MRAAHGNRSLLHGYQLIACRRNQFALPPGAVPGARRTEFSSSFSEKLRAGNGTTRYICDSV